MIILGEWRPFYVIVLSICQKKKIEPKDMVWKKKLITHSENCEYVYSL